VGLQELRDHRIWHKPRTDFERVRGLIIAKAPAHQVSPTRITRKGRGCAVSWQRLRSDSTDPKSSDLFPESVSYGLDQATITVAQNHDVVRRPLGHGQDFGQALDRICDGDAHELTLQVREVLQAFRSHGQPDDGDLPVATLDHSERVEEEFAGTGEQIGRDRGETYVAEQGAGRLEPVAKVLVAEVDHVVADRVVEITDSGSRPPDGVRRAEERIPGVKQNGLTFAAQVSNQSR
tara:strand:+ start:5914 stop:6618 length:705 start_codon:yes stop_codon:yes gene_type:complete